MEAIQGSVMQTAQMAALSGEQQQSLQQSFQQSSAPQ
jgi:hypothetical protein